MRLGSHEVCRRCAASGKRVHAQRMPYAQRGGARIYLIMRAYGVRGVKRTLISRRGEAKRFYARRVSFRGAQKH